MVGCLALKAHSRRVFGPPQNKFAKLCFRQCLNIMCCDPEGLKLGTHFFSVTAKFWPFIHDATIELWVKIKPGQNSIFLTTKLSQRRLTKYRQTVPGLTDSELRQILHGRGSGRAVVDRFSHHQWSLTQSHHILPTVNSPPHLQLSCVTSVCHPWTMCLELL